MVLVAIAAKFEIKQNFLLSSNSLQNLQQIKQKTAEILHFHFFIVLSVTSYLYENEAENLQYGDVHFAQILDFGMGYLENTLAH